MWPEFASWLENRMRDGVFATPSLIWGKRHYLTYLDFSVFVRSRVEKLNGLGVQPGERVMVTLPPHPESFLLLTALVSLGAVPAPIPYDLPREYLISLAHTLIPPVHLISIRQDKPYRRPISPFKIVDTHKMWEYEKLDTGQRRQVFDKDLENCLVVFTSGSTGPHKAVRITYDNILSSVAATESRFGIKAGVHWHLQLPLHHIEGLMVWFRCLVTGGTLEVGHPLAPTVSGTGRGGGWVTSIVPKQLDRILRTPLPKYHSDVSNMSRLILVAGGPVSRFALEASEDFSLPIYQTYGSTETTSMVAASSPREFPDADVTTKHGELYPLRTARLDFGFETVRVTGPMVSPGYEQLPNRKHYDSITLPDRVHPTRHLSGFSVMGRSNRIISHDGKMVDLVYLEQVLKTNPSIGEAVAIGLEDSELGHIIAAAYVGNISMVDLESWCMDLLPEYQVPTEWCRLDELPTVRREDNPYLGGYGLARAMIDSKYNLDSVKEIFLSDDY